MTIPYTRWPDDLSARYRQQGYWLDLPLTDSLQRQLNNSAIAVINGEHHYSYAQLAQQSHRLAAALQRRGLKNSDTALVQLGNIAEFYVTFFALMKLGVAPVNALFSHQRSELNAYALQIQPALLIADRQHPLYANDDYLNQLRQEMPALHVVALHNDHSSAPSLAGLIDEAARDFCASPSTADEAASFQLSGGSIGTPKLIPRKHNDDYYSIRASEEICRFNEATIYLNALPSAHNYAMSSPGSLGVFYGAGSVDLANDPSANLCFPLIEKQQVNVAALVPAAVSLCLQAIAGWGSNLALASLQLLQVGSAKLSESLGHVFRQKLAASCSRFLAWRKAGQLHPSGRRPAAYPHLSGLLNLSR